MSSGTLIRVAVASDNRLFCDGLVHVLSGEIGLAVDALDRLTPASFAGLARSYDVVLLDAHSADSWPKWPTVPDGAAVIMMNAPDEDDWAAVVLSAGARGILTQAATPADVVSAVHVVHGGGIWARRRWLNACVLHVVGDAKRQLASHQVLDTCLSRREREVLRHAATGISNKELAARLTISEATVKVHLTRIFQKLGVNSRAALAAEYGRTSNGLH
jgi:DNA-binding NarL/FixJ family response regulator